MRIGVIKSNFANMQIWQKHNRESVKTSPIRSVGKDEFVSSQVHFGSKLNDFLCRKILNLREIENLPSAYSDVLMIPLSTYNKGFKKADLSENLNDAINRLTKFRKNMDKPEGEVFDKIINSPEARKAENLQGALQILLPQHLNNLRLQQFKIINKMRKLSKNLPREDKKILYKSLRRAFQLIKKNDINNTFKRKTLINGLESSLKIAKDKTSFQRVIKEAYKLPTSNNNIDAFAVKYSRRSSKEIEQRLISPSVSTLDHITAKVLGGKDSPENFAIVSSKINEIKNNDEFKDFFIDFDELTRNAQKQVDILINISNNHKIQDIGWYIIVLKNSMLNRSDGKVNLDISKLKLEERDLELIKKILKKQPEIFGLDSHAAKMLEKNCSTLISY